MTRSHATPPGTGSTTDATVTVSVWHNVTHDSAGLRTGYFGWMITAGGAAPSSVGLP